MPIRHVNIPRKVPLPPKRRMATSLSLPRAKHLLLMVGLGFQGLNQAACLQSDLKGQPLLMGPTN